METMSPLAEVVAETFILDAAQDYLAGRLSLLEYVQMAASFGVSTDEAYALVRKVS